MKFLRFICILIATFPFLLPSNTASAMMFPQPIEHDGLTIEQPLVFSGQINNTIKPLTLSFGKTEEIVIKDTEKQIVLAEVIVEEPKEKISLAKKLIPVAEAEEIAEISVTPTATHTPSPTLAPQPTTYQLSNGGLDAEKLFSMSNAYRQSKGLPPLQKDDRACQLAASRTPEISAEVAEGHMHSGLRSRNLPYWNSENIITMRTEEEAFNWWVNDKIHHDAIVGNYTYSCVACHGNACAQEFTNFQPK